MTDELVAFIQARLDEDVAEAQKARDADEDWREADLTEDGVTIICDPYGEIVGTVRQASAGHVIRQGPMRTLRGVEAKRRILHEHCDDGPWHHAEDGSLVRSGPLGKNCTTCVDTTAYYPEDWTLEPYPCRTLRLLASEWSTHPDYQSEWAP